MSRHLHNNAPHTFGLKYLKDGRHYLLQCHSSPRHLSKNDQHIFCLENLVYSINARGPFNASPQEQRKFAFIFLKSQKLAAISPCNTTLSE
jgi:hypothetical protein